MERVTSVLKRQKPATWIFYGDSITHGAVHTFGFRDYPELFAERVRFELGRVQDAVITTAISGDNTRGLLNRFDWRVGRFNPDVVFLMIGMNDCSELGPIGLDEFTGNLNQLAERILALDAVPVMQTTCPILPGQAPDRSPHLPVYMEAIRQVAAEKKLPLIDHYAVWEQNQDKFFYWMSNAIHPNEMGHRAFSRTIFQALDIWDEGSLCCRLFIP